MANRQAIGNHFRVDKSDTSARFHCSFTCPHCHQENNQSFTVDIDTCNKVLEEEGIFVEKFECSYCEKAADVRFFVDQQIN